MDKPKDLEHFIALGKEIDLTGKDLLDFARQELATYQTAEKERQKIERDQRALDREAEKEKIALEEKKLRERERERDR
jgi:hypothetical protein